MPEVTTIQWEHLAILAGMAMHARFLYGDSAAPRKQKKIRKWLEKHYAEQISALPDDLGSCFSPENSDQAVLEFLRACRTEGDLRIKENRTPQALILAPLGEEVQRAMQDLRDEDCGVGMEHLGDGRIALLVDDSPAYRRRLILEDAVLAPECGDWEYFSDMPEVAREGDSYLLRAVGGNTEQEVLRFAGGAYVEFTSYNCTCEQFIWNDPWAYLRALAGTITAKADIPGDHCNAREKALLPLLQEIMMIGAQKTEQPYPLLTQLAREVGCKPSKFDKMLKTWNQRTWDQASRVLCGKEWEPLWREVYRRICCSQEGYPSRVEQRCQKETLEQTRLAVQEFMYSQGFTGQYPDFVKTGPIQGIHLEESYDLVYIAGMEKNSTMHIRCVETLGWQDRMMVQFLCGIALPQKGTEPPDLGSCLFDHKGRTYFRWVRDYDSVYTQELQSTERIMQFARIAVKKVQMQRLNKEEKKLYSFGSADGLAWFWIWMLLGGGLFAVAMVAAFWLLGALVVALLGSWQDIPAVLGAFPWHYMFAFCWIGFGLPMGIIALVAKRK